MSAHGKKILAPIVITVIFVLYLIGYFLLILCIEKLPLVLRIAVGLGSLAPIGVLIYVLVERIQEIRSGEEDDLSQY